MEKTFVILFVFILNILNIQKVSAQVRAVTEYGDSIFVYNNGTWSFEWQEDTPIELDEFAYLEEVITIDTIAEKFICPLLSKKEVTNSTKQFTIKYNDEYWNRIPPGKINSDASFAFESKNEDLWCIILDEETYFDVDVLYKIAKNSMKVNTNSEIKPLKTELLNINGTDVLRASLESNISGLRFIFDNLYFSNEKGSVQFVVWTSDSLYSKRKDEINKLLNGFIVH